MMFIRAMMYAALFMLGCAGIWFLAVYIAHTLGAWVTFALAIFISLTFITLGCMCAGKRK